MAGNGQVRLARSIIVSVPEPVLTPVWIDSHSLIPRMVGRPGNEAMIPTHHTGSDVH